MFEQVRLGDFFQIKHGFAFKGEHFSSQGDYVVLTPGNFKADGGIKFKGEKEKYYSVEPPTDYVLERGDLIVVMTDLTQEAKILGASAIVPENDRLLHNQRLGKVVDLNTNDLDERYLYHIFNWSFVREQLKGTATGATVKHTAPDRIYAVEIPLPPLPIQQRIAGILSAYDDLIEVNTRRIKALEEMARRTYEEWFVRERNEQAGCPEEWKWTTLGEYCTAFGGTIQTGPFGSQLHKSDYVENGTPVVMPKNIIGGRIDQDACAKITATMAEKLSRHKLQSGDIVFARRGDIGRKAFIRANDTGCICGTGCLKVSLGNSDAASHYVSHYFDEQETIQELAGRAIGATMPNLNTRILAEMPFPIPSEKRLADFEKMSAQQDKLANNFAIQNTNLRAQRDLLLPRLVSGAIDVSDAEATLPEPAEVAAE